MFRSLTVLRQKEEIMNNSERTGCRLPVFKPERLDPPLCKQYLVRGYLLHGTAMRLLEAIPDFAGDKQTIVMASLRDEYGKA